MWRLVIVAVGLLLPQAQSHPTIEVGKDRLLSASGPARPLEESQLSTDHNNPKHLLVVVIQFDSPDGNDKTSVAWSSRDGGYGWTRHTFPARGCADPLGVILPDGSAVMAMLGYITGHDDNAFLFRSSDGRRTWLDTPLGLGDHHDRPMVISRSKEVYVVSSQGVPKSANRRRSSAFIVHSNDEGKTGGTVNDGDVEALYDRPLPRLRYFDGQVGVREDVASGPDRTWLALGIEGLAPGFFQFEPTVYFRDGGHVAGRITTSYDLLITQRLIAQPEVEMDFYSKSDPQRLLGTGLSDLDTGLRVRYEISRKFAPYVGFAYTRDFGGTATLSHAAWESTAEPRFVFGLRVWYRELSRPNGTRTTNLRWADQISQGELHA
jgi:Copper resistance protein B precursor (CopB)